MTTTRLSPGDRARWEATCSEIAGFGVSRDRIALTKGRFACRFASMRREWKIIGDAPAGLFANAVLALLRTRDIATRTENSVPLLRMTLAAS